MCTQLAAPASRVARHPGARLPSRPLARARRAHSVPPQAGAGPRLVSGDLVSDAPRVPADVVAALDRAPGRALMLGHVHPDADVLGTLLAIGEALQARRWSVVAGGPHPAPRALSFLPGVERYEVLKTPEGALDGAGLTACPHPRPPHGALHPGE